MSTKVFPLPGNERNLTTDQAFQSLNEMCCFDEFEYGTSSQFYLVPEKWNGNRGNACLTSVMFNWKEDRGYVHKNTCILNGQQQHVF